MEKEHEYICPKCGGKVSYSGFNGNLFCWGKCSHYLDKEEIEQLHCANQQTIDFVKECYKIMGLES
jgi:hypothetical protein